MNLTLLMLLDLTGTIAFAISGAIVGIHRGMDIFGVNVLAVCTACGGGLMRDLIIGKTPPALFANPLYVCVAAAVANVVFLLLFLHRKIPRDLVPVYDSLLFWFDTLGLAAFSVDGCAVGIHAGYSANLFLVVFLGFITAVGGGALRDVLARRMPDIFWKHVYALASIIGSILFAVLYDLGIAERLSMIIGFCTVLLIRVLARHYHWNLPRVHERADG